MTIKVLHCIESVGSGGVEQRRLALAQSLDSASYNQALICTKISDDMRARFEAAGCAVYAIGAFRMPLDPGRIAVALPIIRGFKPHIIHGAIFEGISIAAVAGRIAGVPVIIGEETTFAIKRSQLGWFLFRILAAMTHRVVAVSPQVQDYLSLRLNLPPSKLTLVTNGVVEVGPAQKSELKRVRSLIAPHDDDFVIGGVGRMYDDYKRFSDLIRALPALLGAGVKARLVLVGPGPDRPSLERLAVELNVADRVYFAGFQADTRPWFEAMDVFVHVAAHESFGLVLVEAMFAGKPVVATRVGGMLGIVDDKWSGMFVDVGQPDQIAAALLALWLNPRLRARMGAVGLIRARKMFSAKRYVYDIEALYVDLLSNQTRIKAV